MLIYLNTQDYKFCGKYIKKKTKHLSSTQKKCSKIGLALPHTCLREKHSLKRNELPPMMCQQISTGHKLQKGVRTGRARGLISSV